MNIHQDGQRFRACNLLIRCWEGAEELALSDKNFHLIIFMIKRNTGFEDKKVIAVYQSYEL